MKSPRSSPDSDAFGKDRRRAQGGAVADSASDNASGPAFSYVAPLSMPLPVLVAVPHAGRAYPGEVLSAMRDAELSQLRLEDRHIDLVASAIARVTGCGLLVANAPRAMIDLNRAEDDIDWEMVDGPRRRRISNAPLSPGNHRARSGLGLVPRRLPGFGEIWRERLPREELDRRIDRIHQPYHAFLAGELARIRDAWGAALLVDLHSMPPLRRQAAQERAPQVVLGDRFGAACDHGIVARAMRHLGDRNVPVSHNRPYSGGYVLDRHSTTHRGVHAIQVEVCRSMYLDDRLAEPGEGLEAVAEMLSGLVRELGGHTARLGAVGPQAQAAE